jgi:hypothetical protein
VLGEFFIQHVETGRELVLTFATLELANQFMKEFYEEVYRARRT